MNLGLSWWGAVSALPLFAFAYVFLKTWREPDRFGDRMVRYLMYVMLLEFIVVHSSALLGSLALGDASLIVRIAQVGGLMALYSVFAGAYAVACHSTWPLFSFWALTLTKLSSLMLDPPGPQGEESLRLAWGFMAGAYVIGAGVTTFGPIPRLGITPEVVKRQDFQSSGLWVEQPHRVVAFGFLYFAALGCFELVAHAH